MLNWQVYSSYKILFEQLIDRLFKNEDPRVTGGLQLNVNDFEEAKSSPHKRGDFIPRPAPSGSFGVLSGF